MRLLKKCVKCNINRELTEFYKRENSKLRNECKICLKSYREANKEHTALKKLEWSTMNKEYLALYSKKYYQHNKAKRNSYNNTYIQNRSKVDFNFKLSRSLRSRLATAIKNNQKTGSAVKDLGCSVDELKNYLESKFQSGMTWENWGSLWDIDHVQPLCKFDLSDKEQFLIAVNFKNLQPLLKKDHLLKTIEDRR